MTKKCYKCKTEKNEAEFSKSQFARSGSLCRECSTLNTKKYREKNIDKIKSYQKEYDVKYYEDNKDKILEQKAQYYQENKSEILEDRKEFYIANRDKKIDYNKKYYKENKEQILKDVASYSLKNKDAVKKYHNYYGKEQRKNNIQFRLRCNISANIGFYLRSNGMSKNKKSTLKYLPYGMQELKEHLENQLEPWMNWNNYGKYGAKTWDDNDQSTWTWQIDHIIPHSTFQYTSMEDEAFKTCWSLDNLRPYSSKQNFLDGATRIRH